MARHFAWILAAALAGTIPAAASAVCTGSEAICGQADRRDPRPGEPKRQQRSRFVKWWEEPQERAELGITDQQAARIEEIFQSTLPAQRQRYEELRKLEPAVEQLIKDGTADPAFVDKQVERFEYLSAEVRRTRTLTLYRIHRELSAEQRAKLKAMFDRRDAERRK